VYDRNEKLFVYFLHSGKIFYWTEHNKQSRYEELLELCTTSSTALHSIKDGVYIFLQDEFDNNGKLSR
jgi:hypothetical protein